MENAGPPDIKKNWDRGRGEKTMSLSIGCQSLTTRPFLVPKKEIKGKQAKTRAAG
jgi:hypothetical protein